MKNLKNFNQFVNEESQYVDMKTLLDDFKRLFPTYDDFENWYKIVKRKFKKQEFDEDGTDDLSDFTFDEFCELEWNVNANIDDLSNLLKVALEGHIPELDDF